MRLVLLPHTVLLGFHKTRIHCVVAGLWMFLKFFLGVLEFPLVIYCNSRTIVCRQNCILSIITVWFRVMRQSQYSWACTHCVSCLNDVSVFKVTMAELQSSLSHCHANTLCKAISQLVWKHLASQKLLHDFANTLLVKSWQGHVRNHMFICRRFVKET